mmetsp:Transcript_56046/g.112338  ORF Transcript_56046/g.112338 Transcript_56046/m.112338 type:complete len:398 (+) Transcript_56046:2-1195(+)
MGGIGGGDRAAERALEPCACLRRRSGRAPPESTGVGLPCGGPLHVLHLHALWRRAEGHLLALRYELALFQALAWVPEQAPRPAALGAVVALLLLEAGAHPHLLLGIDDVCLRALATQVALASAQVLDADAAAGQRARTERRRRPRVDGGPEALGRRRRLVDGRLRQHVEAQRRGRGHALLSDRRRLRRLRRRRWRHRVRRHRDNHVGLRARPRRRQRPQGARRRRRLRRHDDREAGAPRAALAPLATPALLLVTLGPRLAAAPPLSIPAAGAAAAARGAVPPLLFLMLILLLLLLTALRRSLGYAGRAVHLCPEVDIVGVQDRTCSDDEVYELRLLDRSGDLRERDVLDSRLPPEFLHRQLVQARGLVRSHCQLGGAIGVPAREGAGARSAIPSSSP